MSRISPGTVLLAIIAVMFGLLGAFGVHQYLNKEKPKAEVAAPESVAVPVASIDLKAGREITLSDIAILKLTREQMKKKGISGAFMSNTAQIIGRVLQQDVKRGATFDTSLFYPEGTGPSVAERLKPGLRAVTVSVEIDAAVAGLADVGSWVDVFFRSEADTNKDLPETTVTLLRGVQVLALNQETFDGTRTAPPRGTTTKKTSVTLGVTPQQVTALKVVQNRGTLTLALRHPDDIENVDTDPFRTLDELLNRRASTKFLMEIYRGRRRTKVDFEQDQRITSADVDLPIPSATVEPNQQLNTSATLITP